MRIGMVGRVGRVGLVGLAVWLISAVAAAETSAELDQRMRADVARVSTDAAAAYDRGNVARVAHRTDDAIAAYRAAIAIAPNVDHPHRRLCSELANAGRFDDAVAECETALALAPTSPYNQVTLAGVLVRRKHAGDLPRALQLSRDATDTLPDDPSAVGVRCTVLFAVDHEGQFAACAKHMIAIMPDDPIANFYSALVAADAKDFAAARAYLDKAKGAGIEPRTYDQIARAIDDFEEANATVPAWARTTARLGFYVIAIWLALNALLIATGVRLSWRTLRTVAIAGDAVDTPLERRMRAIYRTVLLLVGLCFYVSIPILLAAILATGGVVIAVLIELADGLPLTLALAIALAVFAMIGSIWRILFARAPVVAPGELLVLADHPALRALLDDVARVSNTRPVDIAYLIPGTMLAIREDRGLWASLRGQPGERSVLLGVGLFDGMKQLELRALLAHEYGHVRDGDTAGGSFALAVRRAMDLLADRLRRGGFVAKLSPVWWFLRAQFRAYYAISQGASRLQEVQADRWAIQAYGSAGFIAGFRHAVEREVEFEHDLGPTIDEVIKQHLALPNLYAYEPPGGDDSEAALETKLAAAMAREPKTYDSHPSARQRLAWAEQLAVEHAAQPDDDAPVWALFADRDAIERAMTAVVRTRVNAKFRVEIPDEAPIEEAAASSNIEPS